MKFYYLKLQKSGLQDLTTSEFRGQALMTYLLHVDERLSQVVVENVGVSFFVALHGTDGHDYAVFVASR